MPRLAATRLTDSVLTSTDGWTTCALGHRHWGRAGAAGLFLHRDGLNGREVLLQHRAAWSHHGGTWGTPGGALHEGEPAHAGALREVQEELGLRPDDVVLGAFSVDDHGGWSYTTVLAVAAEPLQLRPVNFESTAIRWWDVAEVAGLPLHYGFAATWPALRDLLDAAPR
jgi:8-oxo-dGTP pyrophosphatase MutT (NUDIX family)